MSTIALTQKALAANVSIPSSIPTGPTVDSLASSVTNILLWVAGVAGVIAIVVGGIMYATSAGDEKRVQSAKNTILYAVVGIIIALLAWGIASFVITNIT